MLGSKLQALDIPSDGASITSVKIDIDPDDGLRTWTVVFKERTSSAANVQKQQAPPPQTVLPPPAPADEVFPIAAEHITNLKVPKLGPALCPADPLYNLRMDRIFPLQCQVQTYAWGKLGEGSLVGRLAASGLDDFELNQGTPYSELWMGTHPSGPSMVTLSAPWRTVTPLSEWIKLNPSLLGPRRLPSQTNLQKTASIRAHTLPFLFKILSVRTALSIQAHPDKALARSLHFKQPTYYKDDNHKPEMAVAITPFEALCSFQPVFMILANCRATPELVELVGEFHISSLESAAAERAAATNATANAEHAARVDELRTRLKAALRAVFEALMTAPADRVANQLNALVKRVQSTNEMLRAPIDVVAMRLHEQYPGDVGVFCIYLLNYQRLKPGEALFLAANEPHAYISGDCAEVMATSDNVVRAGLTPKWKDVETLCSMLTYNDGAPSMVPAKSRGPYVWNYSPPEGCGVDEFTLDRIEVGNHDCPGSTATLPASKGLAIFIIVNGTASVEQINDETDEAVGLMSCVGAGAIHLICPHTVLRIKAQQTPLLAFRATAKIQAETQEARTGQTAA
uniref:mannose-6-phosphate isomerase n=1 Tax=Haptolina brevifila TaxID=156173 RepID=A0A6U7MSP4_9EUKA